MAFHGPASVNDSTIDKQLSLFPSSRYMGSKQAILPFLFKTFSKLEFSSALDGFSGSSAVSYLLKTMNKQVTSNDFSRFCYHTADALVANNHITLNKRDIAGLLAANSNAADFIQSNFADLYFADDDNRWLDNVTANIRNLKNPTKQSLAYAALARACLRKRPRGVFTYTGLRYDDGRRDLQLSLSEQFKIALDIINSAVFNNGCPNLATNEDIFALETAAEYDLIYIDTPYVSPHSDNDYWRRYHFVEGLTRYWNGLEILQQTSTKKFRRIPSAFDSKATVHRGFERLFDKYNQSIIVVSYSSNGIPSKEELASLLRRYKRRVTVTEVDHRYSFGTHAHKRQSNQNSVKEYLFVGQ
ncbi:MAG: DNA adenine methylase [Anaerolineales bacterium]|nr:DNA adenine methylase [Anaerolineales bacterium]